MMNYKLMTNYKLMMNYTLITSMNYQNDGKAFGVPGTNLKRQLDTNQIYMCTWLKRGLNDTISLPYKGRRCKANVCELSKVGDLSVMCLDCINGKRY